MTNLNKEKEEIIYELVLSLNNGNTYYATERVEVAIKQYDELVKQGIITERCEHDWITNMRYDASDSTYQYERVCTKCGKKEIRSRSYDI